MDARAVANRLDEAIADRRILEHPFYRAWAEGRLDLGDLSFYAPSHALGMIYGYESQTPAVAETKVRGLRDHYGIDGDGVEYFDLHGELDVTHAAELAAAIADVAADGALNEAATGARLGAGAIWTLLDGVARARAIA